MATYHWDTKEAEIIELIDRYHAKRYLPAGIVRDKEIYIKFFRRVGYGRFKISAFITKKELLMMTNNLRNAGMNVTHYILNGRYWVKYPKSKSKLEKLPVEIFDINLIDAPA